MFGVGYQELVVIFLIILVFYGGSKIPEIARGLGKGIKEFKKAKDGVEDSIHETMSEIENEPKPQTQKDDKKDGAPS